MANILKKYGVWEYVLFLFGLLILGKLAFAFLFDALENTFLNAIALVVGLLCVAKPLTIVEIAKNKAQNIKQVAKSIQTKNTKNGTDE